MIRCDLNKWGQTLQDLHHQSLHAPHPRTRERFAALFQIASGKYSASAYARLIGRRPETVLSWLRLYNSGGPQALHYARSGGHRPLFVTSPASTSPGPSSKRPPSNTACPGTTGRSGSSDTGSARLSA